MANDGKQISATIPNSSTISHTHDNPHLQITIEKLNAHNYLRWVQSVILYVKSRGRMDYLDGTKGMPEKESTTFAQWEKENFMVMSWLINSMQPDIGGTYIFFKSTRKIWEAIKQAYSKVGNDGLLFELRNLIRDTKQGDADVTTYFNKLRWLWLELDHYQNLELKSIVLSLKFTQTLERERIFDFLVGLNLEYDPVCSLILGRSPLPSLNEAFSIVRGEESQRCVMLKDETYSSALVANKERKPGAGKKKAKIQRMIFGVIIVASAYMIDLLAKNCMAGQIRIKEADQ